jgi:phosphoserine phosphatase RsbU/P
MEVEAHGRPFSLGPDRLQRGEFMMSPAVSPQQPQSPIRDAALRNQLLARRDRLEAVLRKAPPPKFQEMLKEIDAALERMEAGTFGICETCHDTIESDRLLLDPLTRNCLDHLSIAERRALERDLDLALEVQQGLLPPEKLEIAGWNMAYCYRPLGPVSGDYCDVLPLAGEAGLFMLGDVAGKGVAASMLMAQLHAIFRSLVPVSTASHPQVGTRTTGVDSLSLATVSVRELVGKANRIFCQGNPTCHFATLVCGHLDGLGNVEMCNAGHCPPLWVSPGEVKPIESMGLPVGVLVDGEYPSQSRRLAVGDSLVLYTDGLSEAMNSARELYGAKRLAQLVARHAAVSAQELLAVILQNLADFQAGQPRFDDLTVMVLQRTN